MISDLQMKKTWRTKMQKKGKLNKNPLRQQTCLRIRDFSFLAKGELGLWV